MAQVNIFEMGDLNHSKPVRRIPFNASQALSSSPSAAFAGGTRYITVQTDTTIYVKIGSSATTLTDYRINANDERDFEVDPGQKLYWTT